MPKVLGQAGISIADTYDVEGSIAGVEELDSHSVKTVHEMGSTIFSERLSGGFSRMGSGDILQSTSWDLTFDLSAIPIVRVMNVIVISDNAGRIAHCNVSVRDDPDGREVPIWIWDAGPDIVTSIRTEDSGVGVADQFTLRPGITQLPSMLLGTDQSQPVNLLTFRGVTTAFGAGTVNPRAIIHTMFATVGGISSFGVPIPSW